MFSVASPDLYQSDFDAKKSGKITTKYSRLPNFNYSLKLDAHIHHHIKKCPYSMHITCTVESGFNVFLGTPVLYHKLRLFHVIYSVSVIKLLVLLIDTYFISFKARLKCTVKSRLKESRFNVKFRFKTPKAQLLKWIFTRKSLDLKNKNVMIKAIS